MAKARSNIGRFIADSHPGQGHITDSITPALNSAAAALLGKLATNIAPSL
jgi:hypothetical protein